MQTKISEKKYALLSTSDKKDLPEFARSLADLGYTLLSTGGTHALLREAGLAAQELGELTGVGELFGGRVKSLHPLIHGGILYRRDTHAAEAAAAGVPRIDLVCVNLYPFAATIRRTDDLDEIIEKIDIGGPALLRAAAKNYKDVLVLCESEDYEPVLAALHHKNKDRVDEVLRRRLMIRAFEHVGAYEALIANYFNARFCGGFGERHFITGKKICETKYGENPHQQGALYEFDEDFLPAATIASGDPATHGGSGFFSRHFFTLKGEASFNNLADLNAALALASGPAPAVAIIKHANPCGYATGADLPSCLAGALLCDPVSAYGGVVAINGPVDEALAEALARPYFEVILAPFFSPQALKILSVKKRVKLFSQQDPAGVAGGDTGGGGVAGQGGVAAGGFSGGGEFARLIRPRPHFDFRHIAGGFLLQSADEFDEAELGLAVQRSRRAATPSEWEDLKIALKIAALTKSNNLAYVRGGTLLAIGMGMTSRVDAGKAALAKATAQGLDLAGAVLASEAFFPFADSIHSAAAAGVSAIIAPGGSIRDEEVIAAADEAGLALYFAPRRHFLH